ncbi:MAG: 30S ribosomal protein S8 [Candidatus Latescibacterota bacterium]|jgi:small subunit ribosomal protein S8|nr:MAG: 30S ribosomal protein S8 [Candidatus Latescibacterota bacterium]
MMTDPIADMLTRIRNGIKERKSHVDIPASRMKAQIAKVLLDHGYVKNVKYMDDDKQGVLRVYLKYDEEKRSAIEGLRRVSLASRRVYVTKDRLPRVQGGYGTAIISTSKGLLTDKECRALGVGGEVLCHIW